MQKELLLKKLQRVESLAATSRLGRLVSAPFKYLGAILHRQLVFPYRKKSWETYSNTFWGGSMALLLPASTDIYLTGGKSHDSEIRLAKFLILQLNPGDTFVDIGTHYGYFSLLALELVGTSGKVFSFEASPVNYGMLEKNTRFSKNVEAINAVISDSEGMATFYEFPNLYSEYNTLDVSQFEKEDWFKKNPPVEKQLPCITMDSFFQNNGVQPKVVKIDVEGAEFMVLRGMKEELQQQNLTIVIEYLSEKRGNENHLNARDFLNGLGYKSFSIKEDGQIQFLENIPEYLRIKGLDSDNIVFQKGF
jgi:FkbM family methyltransferase